MYNLAPSPSPTMKTLHKQTIISAVVLIALSLVAATPIPVPVTGSEPGVVPLELLNDKVPFRTISHIATLPNAVDSDDELGLRARESTNTEKKQRKPILVTIPPGFLPGEIDSDLQMALPSVTELNWWGSVIHIISLMKAAAKQNPKLRTELHAFEVEMEKKAHGDSVEDVISRLRRKRPTALPTQAMTELDLDLETIQDRIKTAVEKHNEFEGEVQIPYGFLPGTTELGMKIPHPENMEALKSVEFILNLMESALSRDKREQRSRFKGFKQAITAVRFNLVLRKLRKRILVEHLKDEDLHAIQGKIMEAVEKHNDNYWWYDGKTFNYLHRPQNHTQPFVYVQISPTTTRIKDRVRDTWREGCKSQ
ncbi:hypothetical protein H0H93_000807 [Arthromyces matolae]|nr:hypothetical protein H0H93_000807 [Arthromyces matolae]